MANSGTFPSDGEGGDLHLYPTGGGAATPGLAAFLRESIRARGPMPFPGFMGYALYHPEWGYYARGISQTGRRGDFFTSVSVGPLFGRLLARRFLRWWRESGRPRAWRVLEAGAHDGRLALDVLEALRVLDAEAFGGVEYAIVEPLPRLMAAQRETLREFAERVVVVKEAGELGKMPGVVFGNEVLDALPFEVLEYRGGWRRGWVGLSEEAFQWQFLPWDGAAPEVEGKIAEGYRTELRTNFGNFLGPLLGTLERGLLVFADYGFEGKDYYHPARSEGTLRTFSGHRAGEDPLVRPGEMDITAHVDFTSFADEAAKLGCRPEVLKSQGAWLTMEAKDWLLEQEGKPDPGALRQFQTLTHPAQLGGRFLVMELAWDGSAAG